MTPSTDHEGVVSNNNNCTNANSSTSSWLEVWVAEEMNPSRRCHMEDCAVVHHPGTWNAADPDLAYLGVYDGKYIIYCLWSPNDVVKLAECLNMNEPLNFLQHIVLPGHGGKDFSNDNFIWNDNR